MFWVGQLLVLARTSLQCRECKKEYETAFKYVCDECFGPLDVKYDFPTLTKDTFSNREQTYWRYFELLPIENKSNIVNIGAGMTPLTKAENLGKKLGQGLEELTLTTNGSQLDRYAKDLFENGVRRINVSLDSLEKNKFKKITRIGDLDKVINGIMVAKKAGLKIKINAVALKGINDNEILNLVNWCGENKFSLTFIEVMPMGEIGEKRADQYMPLTEVKSLIQTKYSLTEDSLRTGGPARYVHCHETDQKIGFITPHTHNFCELCNRVRVTCTGEMYMCLGQQDKADLKTPLRKSENNQILKDVIYEAISRKPKGHDFIINRKKEEKFVPRHMNVTGG